MKKIFALIIMILVCISSVVYATDMKLYRNREWQFRIDIPASFEYSTPKSPNTLMMAHGNNRSSINIVAKKMPIKEASAEDLTELANAQREANPVLDKSIISSGITYVNNSPAHWALYNTEYRTPTDEFKLTILMFQFVKNYKYYAVSYGIVPELYTQTQPIFMQSISSFVDETGFY